MLGDVGFDEEIAQQACDYLTTITTSEGAVPWMLPSAHQYPRAFWWNTVDDPPASLNPTAGIVGLLHKNGFRHPWIEGATAFCWRKIADYHPTKKELDEMGDILNFLYHVPNRQRAEEEIARLILPFFSDGLVADVEESGYVRKPLDWAATPEHPLRSYFREDEIRANLDAIVAGQQTDGGWTIPWEAVSPACELEWRGWVTVNSLRTLAANGRLGHSPEIVDDL